MDMNGIYQKDNKFDGEESLYYVLAGNGGSSRLSKNEKYHIITCSAVAIYDIREIMRVNHLLLQDRELRHMSV